MSHRGLSHLGSLVQKAASLLQQTVTELNQLKLEDEQQTQLTEKTEEIQALLSSVSLRTAPSVRLSHQASCPAASMLLFMS